MTQEEIDYRKEQLFGLYQSDTRSKMEIGFEHGIVFAQNKLYSEEEVLELLLSCNYHYSENIKEWFKENKKK